ncbi:MAG: LysM peptidoglycan-binding domain-containing protein [Acidobacteriota bacterium]|nr:LysM peptidoglycan-binding domain-containing protein [Acidobacteriota bacterium]
MTPPGPPPEMIALARPYIDVLIDQVEQDFRMGEKEYQADDLPAARVHFDAAIQRLMASGMNYSVDPRLEPLMDRLINTMHEYQMKTEQEGIEAGGQQGEPGQPQLEEPASPLEEIAAAANLPANPEVAQKAAAELLHVPHDLPLTVNEPVLTFLNFFQTSRGRKIIEHSLARSGRYRDMVRQVLKQEGLPQDLMYLPLPESGYQPRATSRVGARGLWQFMPETGRLYGLKINRWEDQRMDPVASTHAAAEHLRDLYGIFHDWYLALAAYDSGSLTVARAIERTGYADFWQLYRLNAFPSVETKNYVPIMLAMTLVAKDPGLYGVDVTDPQEPLKTDPFKPGRSVDLRLVADAIGIKTEELREMNPALFGVVTPDDPSFALRVPAGTEKQLLATLQTIPPSRWVGWRLHHVTADDTLASVAQQYKVHAAALAAANDLSAGDPLTPGKLLLVPAPVMPATIYYRVRSGDTVGGIARRYHVSVGDLRVWNHLRSNLIRVGQELRIYSRQGAPRFERVSSRRRVSESRSAAEPFPAEKETRGGVYIVRSGDTFWSISRRYGVSTNALRGANPEAARKGLKVGERIVIPKR